MAKALTAMKQLAAKTTPKLSTLAPLLLLLPGLSLGHSLLTLPPHSPPFQCHLLQLVDLGVLRNFFNIGLLAYSSILTRPPAGAVSGQFRGWGWAALVAASFANLSAGGWLAGWAVVSVLAVDLAVMRVEVGMAADRRLPFFVYNLNHFARVGWILLMGLAAVKTRTLRKTAKEEGYKFK
jgi:hypothetical protein